MEKSKALDWFSGAPRRGKKSECERGHFEYMRTTWMWRQLWTDEWTEKKVLKRIINARTNERTNDWTNRGERNPNRNGTELIIIIYFYRIQIFVCVLLMIRIERKNLRWIYSNCALLRCSNVIVIIFNGIETNQANAMNQPTDERTKLHSQSI